MSRLLRIEFPVAYYHMMNRGLACQEIFTDRVDQRYKEIERVLQR